MSMREYSFQDIGLVLSEEVLKCVAQKAYKDFSEEEWKNCPIEYIDDIVNEYDLGYNSDFTGEAVLIDSSGNDNWNDTEYYDSDQIYYLPVQNFPNLFSRAYNDMDELIAEFRNSEIGKLLPDDFDYPGNIRHIVGTYYG